MSELIGKVTRGSMREQARPRNAKARWIDRRARSLVLRRLGALREGRLEVRDAMGVELLGEGATVDSLHVHDLRTYTMMVTRGSLGAAEAYLRGWWRSDDLTGLLRLFVRNIDTANALERGVARLAAPLAKLGHLLRRNTRAGSRKNIHAHYDLGNALFELMLDETMTYSCGVFTSPHATLRAAQVEKLDRLCRKLRLRPGDHLLEIGTGWGSMALHAAERYGCRVTTTTISREQRDYATRRIEAAGLSDRIDVQLTDYRDLDGAYDKLVSIEMIEAVGYAYLDTYFAKCAALLKRDGAMAIQAITSNEQTYDRTRRSVDFIQRYIFPGSHCPALSAMTRSIGRATDLRVQHVEEIGPHYATTLRRWRERFFDRIDGVCRLGYDERFVRMWDYYLSYCEAGFAERFIGDVQIVLTKPRCGFDATRF